MTDREKTTSAQPTAPLRVRPMRPDGFTIFTYTLVAAALLSQLYFIFWLDLP